MRNNYRYQTTLKAYIFLLVIILTGCTFRLLPKEPIESTTSKKTASMRIFEKGKQAFFSSDYISAEKQFRQSISLYPFNPYPYHFLGQIRLESKKYDEAISFFQKALLRWKNNPSWKAETLFRMGTVLREKGNIVGAREQFIKAIELDANHVEAKKALEEIK